MKYVLAIFGVFVIVVLAIVLFRGRGSKPANNDRKKPIVLSDIATNADAQVTYTLDGPITAEETHNSVRITVTPSERVLEIVRGYQNDVISTQRYNNNQDAFAQFLEALNKVNFIKERGKTKISQNGVCPTGMRYIYQIDDGADELLHTWSATCNKGTFGGNPKTVRQLFQAQIPEFNLLTKDVNFSMTK